MAMGIAIFEREALAYRPATLDRVSVYPAEDGQCLYQVYKREKGTVYWLLRWACKLARCLQRLEYWYYSTPESERSEVTNPNGVERQGLWATEEKAQAECVWLKEVSGGQAAVGYEEVKVNRTTGYVRRHMRGLTDPTKWLLPGEINSLRARFTFVECETLTELEEWRSGDRRFTDADCRFKEMAELLPEIDSRLRALEHKVQSHLEGTGHAGSVT